MKKNTRSPFFLLLMFLVLLTAATVFLVRRSAGYAAQTMPADTAIQRQEAVDEQPGRSARKASRRTEESSRNVDSEKMP